MKKKKKNKKFRTKKRIARKTIAKKRKVSRRRKVRRRVVRKKIRIAKKSAKKAKRKIRERKISKKKARTRRIKRVVRTAKPLVLSVKKTISETGEGKEIEKQEEIENKERIFDEVRRTKIRLIGIGGGAGSVVSELASNVKKVDFVAVNTDAKSLNALTRKVKHFQFGQNVTKNLGTGMHDELGEMAALEDKEKIKKLFEGQDLCLVVACLGGGTSSGATPVFVKIAKSLGIPTYGIFTMPFNFEGERKREMASRALEKIRQNLNVFSIIPNERIFQVIDKNTPLKGALSAMNKKMAENLESLIEMIHLPGLINIDFADLRTVLHGRGRIAYLNTIEFGVSNKEEAIQKLVSSPLYPYTTKGAKGILYNITGGKGLQLSDVSYISKVISESINPNAKIIFGINQNQKYRDRIKVTILATGCYAKIFPSKTGVGKLVEAKAKKIQNIKKLHKKMAKPRKKPAIKSNLIKKEKLTNKKVKPKAISQPPAKRITIRQVQPAAIQASQSLPATSDANKIEVKVRRNGLQLKKIVEEEEREILEREKMWETPAILRKKTTI